MDKKRYRRSGPSVVMRCVRCAFWSIPDNFDATEKEKSEGDCFGECRRYPPQIVYETQRDECMRSGYYENLDDPESGPWTHVLDQGRWPLTLGFFAWCGEFVPRPAEAVSVPSA
jgi:hypothetical protein